ncbi:bcct: transporter, betaine/carnitine/choline transporter (BCCT) family (plasmid) [Rubrobacter radiotolerans]|uniref:BCCT family transporter n=1 Tax=Rubrobacter radiotolerans TaxID=42256 RepID=A0A023X7H1_RUBRA|nr:BCCT family transporter [Rubrobacter radiotolerans]AHY48283.1 bcct: transporter, betaine/carnitine/choline transporter (BCCT) family [Rubrobacter radiotolerans]MDX5895556.1 BCCT family transporter [Rubrobacter radiotolerans]SMC01480.1 choline/glycine/proline betaine transport protein [Rubrobacter radiotolerans DSM 5868]
MRGFLQRHTNPPVFLISGAVIVAFVLAGAVFTEATGTAAGAVQSFITTYFGWFYIVAVTFFLVFAVGLLFTRYGKVRLGPDDSRPEFSTAAWFAMLFTAGMGIGLVYFGVAEPIAHYTSPPLGEGGTEQAAREAMNLTYFHWLLHPWAIYIVFGLSVAYFSFRRGLPLRPASAFYPLLGDRIYGPIGHLVDVLAVFGTMFGLATSLGLGAQQVNSGLSTLFGLPNSTGVQILLILIITALAAVSVVLGIDRGIRNLSLINMWLAAGLALFVFAVGPTVFILGTLVSDTGYYLQNLLGTSLNVFTLNEGAQEWQAGWTLFYWGWWVSWAPFVGLFIARISRGRTVRQFIVGVLLAPVGASAVWFAIFGGTAINYLSTGRSPALAEADSSNALFVLIDGLPVPEILSLLVSVIGIIVVVLFFATSSDSGSLVIDVLTNGGDPEPLWFTRLFWAILEGAVAAVLLLVGGLTALQTASITAGLPFAAVLLVMCWGLVRGFREERLSSEEEASRLETSRRAGKSVPVERGGA